ncbi:MAG: CIC family chloride channel protein [Verrucomicrobiales bacterium]|jgi:CIC family chloride channel protein
MALSEDPEPLTAESSARRSELEYVARASRLRLLPRVVVVGVLAGLIAVAFRVSLRGAEGLRIRLLESVGPGWAGFFLLWVIAAVATGIAIYLVRRFSPAAGGSGIPQLKAVLLHMRRLKPLPVILVKFVGGVLVMGAGLALGREGPTIQMGGAAGKLVGRLFGMTRDERFILIAAGAGAGLSAAFNAPLAGLVFVLEEIQRAFHRRIFFATLLASAVADTISRLALGQEPVFHIPDYPIPSLGLLPVFLLVGIVAGIFGALFNASLIRTTDLMPRILPGRNLFVIAAITGLAVAATSLVSPDLIGSGHHLTESAVAGTTLLGPLFGILVIRFALTMVSYASGAPGGIFAPLLVLGSCAGLAVGLLVAPWYPVDMPSLGIFAVVGMAAMFSATVQAPLTGIVLVVEMTGQHTLMLPLLIACLTAYVIPERLGAKPIYHALMDRELDDYRDRVVGDPQWDKGS